VNKVTQLQILQSDINLDIYEEFLAAKSLLAIDFSNESNGLTFAEAIVKKR
jgi:hypothetical protein